MLAILYLYPVHKSREGYGQMISCLHELGKVWQMVVLRDDANHAFEQNLLIFLRGNDGFPKDSTLCFQ